MRILIANKFYYNRGGDCVYSIGLEKLLQNAGHKTAFFTSEHSQNLDNPYRKYWVSRFSFKTPLRPFGDKETIKNFTELLNDFKPDILHLNNIHTQISPIIAELAHNKGIKVFWTLHDYKLLCPAYSCLDGKGKICEKCFIGDKKFCTGNRCLKKSLLQSFIAQKEAEKWNRARLEKCVDKFICPSQFMHNAMARGGFNKDKLIVLNNFVDIPAVVSSCLQSDKLDYYCYVGRLSREKGIEALLKVVSEISYNLKICGTGPLEAELKEKYKNCKHIEFFGHQSKENCIQIMSNAKITVIPSEWHENNPLSVIESLCLGIPVLGANIGGIPELIEQGINGELFESGNIVDLKNKIEIMMNKNYEFDINKCREKYGAEGYLEGLRGVYRNAI